MLKNYKGQYCWIKKEVFCQEGYCKGCQIYHDWNQGREKRYAEKTA